MNFQALDAMKKKQETAWINPYKLPHKLADAVSQLVLPNAAIEDAHKRLLRFAPFIQKCFPETEKDGGLIESPLVEIPAMQKRLIEEGASIPGTLLLKMDSHLKIAGSVKARGGIYEVLKHAEDLVLLHHKITLEDNYEKFATQEMKDFLGKYIVQVGSTGNLGMSIGIMSAALGFQVKIHMSKDAKQWKKDLLRARGAEVLEYDADYSKAVAEGRENSAKNPYSYFVDDEKSMDLLIGYATAGKRLSDQLEKRGILVDENHPLIVYLPTGVGSAPGGITYGLKQIYGDHVHCFFIEPALCPSVLLGIATQTFEKANVRDYGISGITEADGLACASPSGLVTRLMTHQVSGDFTVSDANLYNYLRMLYESENIRIEPSSCSAFQGVWGLLQFEETKKYCESCGLTEEKLQNATQVAWATGGEMIPDAIYEEYLNTYLK